MEYNLLKLLVGVLFILCIIHPATALQSGENPYEEEFDSTLFEEEAYLDAEGGLQEELNSELDVNSTNNSTEEAIAFQNAPSLYGTISWGVPLAQKVSSTSITTDGSSVVVGTDRPGQVYMLDRSGLVLWTRGLSVPVYAVSMAPDGKYIGVAADRLYLIFPNGREKWIKDMGYFVYSVAVSADGNRIAAGLDDGSIQMFDQGGKLLWKYTTQDNVISTAISQNGTRLVAGSDDRNIYFLDANGRLLWKYTTGDSVRGVSVSADGSFVIGGSADRVAYFFDDTGSLLWRYAARNRINGVSISPEGELAVVFEGSNIHIFNKAGRILWEFDTTNLGHYVSTTSIGKLMGPEVTAASISSGGFHLFAGTGSGDQRIYCFSMSAIKPSKEEVVEGPVARANALMGMHQDYFYSANSSLNIEEFAYISSITRLERDSNSPILVRIAVAPDWVEKQQGGVEGIRITAWNTDGASQTLQTVFLGYDLQNNHIFEAVSEDPSAKFGLISQVDSEEPGFLESLFVDSSIGGILAGVLLIVAVASGVLTLRYVFRKPSKKQYPRKR